MRKKCLIIKGFLFFNLVGQLLAIAVVLYFAGAGFSFAQDLNKISNEDGKILLDAQGIDLPSDTVTDSIAPTSEAPEVPNERLLLENQAVIERTRPPKTSAPSFISDYFARLTGSALSVFGERQFSIESSPELLFFNSVGKDYVLGPGDELAISMRGILEKDVSITVDREGSLILPSLEPLYVSQLTIKDLEKKLTDILQLDDASGQAFVKLNAARLVTVQVSGEVNSPKTIVVPAYTPLSQIFSYVGGISSIGSLRNIVLKQQDSEPVTIDYYEFLLSPEVKSDPLISQSSRVHIHAKGPTVAITGFVARPGIYELAKEKEQIGLKDLLELSGTRLIAPQTNIQLLAFDEVGSVRAQTISRDGKVASGEAVILSLPKTEEQETIKISGAVIEPYQLVVDEELTIFEALKYGSVLSNNHADFLAVTDGVEAQTMSVTDVFSNPNAFEVRSGQQIFIFDEKSYSSLLGAVLPIREKGLLKSVLESTRGSIFINGEKVALLPSLYNGPISSKINAHLEEYDDLYSDFMFVHIKGAENRVVPTSYSGLSKLELESHLSFDVYAFEEEFLLQNRNKIGAPNSGKLFELIDSAKPVKIFYNDEFYTLVAPGVPLNQVRDVQNLESAQNLYTPFAIRFDGDNHSVQTTEDIFLNAFSSSRPQSIFIFSRNFFRENNRFDNQTENLNDASSGVALVSSLDSAETDVKTFDLQESNMENIDLVEQQSFYKSLSSSIISEASVAIQGGVLFPGLYPIANKVTLSDLLEVAGGLTASANPKQISIRKYMNSLVDNEIRQLPEKKIDLTAIDPSAITLSGAFDIFVPKLKNNAAVGSVTLLGELQSPGKFIFGINDTLHDVIERAGGLSEVAYPLGAQFLRKKLALEETKENQLLAEKVARSVLAVAQSDALNSQSQAAAVLGYAEQLKTLSPSGRQVINVAFKDANNPILLEDGDTLIVPKRPSHVTVMGNVQRTVSAPYQSFKGIDDYIIDSGGFDELADEKNIFVQLPNGQNISGNSSTPIPPGSIIIVPPNVNKLTPLAFTDIVSRVLGNIATSLLAINAVQ